MSHTFDEHIQKIWGLSDFACNFFPIKDHNFGWFIYFTVRFNLIVELLLCCQIGWTLWFFFWLVELFTCLSDWFNSLLFVRLVGLFTFFVKLAKRFTFFVRLVEIFTFLSDWLNALLFCQIGWTHRDQHFLSHLLNAVCCPVLHQPVNHWKQYS